MTYLKDWETQAASKTDVPQSNVNKMLLSIETCDGLKMTGESNYVNFRMVQTYKKGPKCIQEDMVNADVDKECLCMKQ